MHVRTLGTGEHFGELALINNDKRSLSVRVKSDKTSLLRLDRDAFTRILGSIENHLMKDYNRDFDEKLQLVKDQKRNFSQTFNKNEFEVIKEEMKEHENDEAVVSCKTTEVNPAPHGKSTNLLSENIENASIGMFSGSK